MSELLFVAKSAVITFAIIILLQVRVGDNSLENHASQWVHESSVVGFFRQIAEGGLAAVHDGWSKVTSGISTKYVSKYKSENQPGKRHLGMAIDRSGAYVEEQRLKAEALAAEQEQKRKEGEAKLSARAKQVKEMLGIDSNDEEINDTIQE